MTARKTIRRIKLSDERDFYRDVVNPGQPVIVVGAMDSWRATRHWSFEWFEREHGEVPVPVEWFAYFRDESGRSLARRGHRREMPFAEYTASVKNGTDPDRGYLIATDMYKRVPALLWDIDFPKVRVHERLIWHVFFMSGAGCYTQLHYDRSDNMSAMVRGRKRWQLFGPARSPELDPVEPWYVWAVFSGLDLGNRHMKSLEELGGVQADYDFVLEEGEILYLPCGWWHRVFSEEASISTNIWWWSYSLALRLVPTLAAARARIAWRQMRNRREGFGHPVDRPLQQEPPG